MPHQDDLDPEDDTPLPEVGWDIRRDGRPWTPEEAFARFELTPEKFEMFEGRLFWSNRDRLLLLGLLLENVGIDAALALGRPEIWREAIQARLAQLGGGEHAE